MNNIAEMIAKNIRKYRKGMSIERLAKKADLPASTIANIYYPRRKDPRISTVIAIAKALGVSIDKLVK
jgi:transcriptional regulator with XRE-family HTH domain